MATTTTRTTQLECVNTMLSTIGESPVNSLSGVLPLDASTAVNILNEVNREVQSAGWKFNTSWKVSLNRDVNNKLVVGADVLHIEFNHLRESKSSYDPVLRGNYLYNLAGETYIWDKDFEYVTVFYLLDFENIPEQARRYITIRASRIYHDRTLGSQSIHKFSMQDEVGALALLKQTESDTADHNIFDSLDQHKIINRNNIIKYST
jgi:hypothetical protein